MVGIYDESCQGALQQSYKHEISIFCLDASCKCRSVRVGVVSGYVHIFFRTKRSAVDLHP